MIFTSSSKDFYYETSASSLSYYITVDGAPIYNGKAFKSPAETDLRINVGRRVSDYLESHMPDFRDYDGVVVPHPQQLRQFALYSIDGTLLEEYTVLMEWTGDWNAYYGPVSNLINGHADPRQKIFWTTVEGVSGKTYPSNTDGGNYKDIVDDGGGDPDSGITDAGYLSFTNIGGNAEAGVIMVFEFFPNTHYIMSIDFDETDIFYSYGHNWVKIPREKTGYGLEEPAIRFKVGEGETIYFKSNLSGTGTIGDIYFQTFGVDGVTEFTVQGYLTSLTHLDNYSGVTVATGECFNFYRLLRGCKHIVDASNLVIPYTTINSDDLLKEMFAECRNLVTAPRLPALELYGSSCYQGMFDGCRSLTTPPDLPAPVIGEESYDTMFRNCANLKYIKVYATSTSDIEGTLSACGLWLENVYPTGTFYCPSGVAFRTPEQGAAVGFFYYTGSWGHSGRPAGWGVVRLD